MGSSLFRGRVTSYISTILAVVFVSSVVAAAQGPQNTFHDPRLRTSVGFLMDLEYSEDMVLTVVKNIASSSVIHGTKIYRKDKEEEIDGAEFAPSSKVFTDTPRSAHVFYKIKKGAIAPNHFPGSTGEGSVIVRYIVQAEEGKPIHLRIDAVYFEESLHARYYSDGNVEAAEYNQIQTQLNEFTAPARARDAVAADSSSKDETAPAPENNPPSVAKSSGQGQDPLVQEQALLAEATAQKQKLEEQLKQLQFNTQGLVKSLAVPLRSYPYNSSSTVLTLGKEERVTVLATSRYWYRIRAPNGQEGWIYYMFLEPLPK
jgi:hypothetical protein